MRETEKKYFEPNNNESIAYQNLLSEDKLLIGGKFMLEMHIQEEKKGLR